jgi:hypothetical protein
MNSSTALAYDDGATGYVTSRTLVEDTPGEQHVDIDICGMYFDDGELAAVRAAMYGGQLLLDPEEGYAITSGGEFGGYIHDLTDEVKEVARSYGELLEKRDFSMGEVGLAIHTVSNEAKKLRDKQNKIWMESKRCSELYATKREKEWLYWLKDLALSKSVKAFGIECAGYRLQTMADKEPKRLYEWEIGGHCIHSFDGYSETLLGKVDGLTNAAASAIDESMTAEDAKKLLLVFVAWKG